MPSRSGRRRQLARLRTEFFNHPLALDARVLGDIQRAISLEDASGAYSLISASMGAGEEIPSQMKIVNGVAIIPVTGVLRDEVDWMVRYFGCSCYEILERDIAAALDNQSVSAVVLWMNTPGGAAIGAKRAADGIFARRGAKPIVAYCRGPFCLMSDEAVKLLAKRGFQASKLADGVAEWLASGMPLEAGTA